MKLRVNGKEVQIDDAMTLLSFLQQRDINPAMVVVEYNYEVYGRERWENIWLKDGDNLEIVKFIGGG